MPMPRPPITRQNARSQMLNGSPAPMPLTVNRNAASSMTLTRPIRSASCPAIHAPIAEPISAAATAKPVWLEPTLKCFWMPVTAPLMTALSYPNRNPPIAAAAAMKTTYPKWVSSFGSTEGVVLTAAILRTTSRRVGRCHPGRVTYVQKDDAGDGADTATRPGALAAGKLPPAGPVRLAAAYGATAGGGNAPPTGRPVSRPTGRSADHRS